MSVERPKRQKNDRQNPDTSADLVETRSQKLGFRSGGARKGAQLSLQCAVFVKAGKEGELETHSVSNHCFDAPIPHPLMLAISHACPPISAGVIVFAPPHPTPTPTAPPHPAPPRPASQPGKCSGSRAALGRCQGSALDREKLWAVSREVLWIARSFRPLPGRCSGS